MGDNNKNERDNGIEKAKAVSFDKPSRFHFRIKVKNEIAEKNIFDDNSPSDDNDINLLLIFGMDEEAKKKNPEKYDELKTKLDNRKNIKGKQEFLVQSQRNEMLKEYKRKAKSANAMLVPSIFMLLLSAAFEYFIFYSGRSLGVIQNYSTSLVPLCALQLFVIICAFGYRRFLSGFRIFLGKPNYNSVFTVTAIVYLAYYIYLIFTGGTIDPERGYKYFLYLTPFALGALMGGVYDSVRLHSLHDSFEIASAEQSKLILKNFDDVAKHHIYRSKEGGRAIRVSRTSFVGDFVATSSKEAEKGGIVTSLIVLSLLLSFGIAFYMILRGEAVPLCISYGIASLAFTAPFSIYISATLLLLSVCRSAVKRSCAVLGEKSISDYATASAVYFSDTAVFPQSKVKLKGFNTYGDNNVDDSLYILASVFKKISSPASMLFMKALGDKALSRNVDLIDISEYGLHCSVDGRCVYMGNAAYMKECHCDAFGGEYEESDYSVLYMASDHKTAIKVYIDYVLDRGVTQTVSDLKKKGMYLGITTMDPSINSTMLNKKIPLRKYPVGIIKTADREDGTMPAASGIVSLLGTHELLKTLLSCVRACGAAKIDSVLRYFVLLAGGAIASLLVIFGGINDSGSFFTALYQFAGILPTAVILAFMKD